MSKTASGAGEAPAVTAVTGPATTGPQEMSMALMEVAITQGILTRMGDKADKAERQAGELVATAEAAHADATDAANAAMDTAMTVLGTDDTEAIRDAAAALAVEHERHQSALAKLAGFTGGGE